MELKNKQLYSETLKQIIAIKKDCGVADGETAGLKYAVDTMPLRVPVVGEFSAGKSSLLNKFIGKQILSVGITPETALPAELYYSASDYDEGIDSNGKATRLSSLDGAAEKYVCLRRHINSDFLKNIEPLVLVDMPGFDSPLDAHNKAIFSYLDKGAHYIVLTPVDAGTVSSSMTQQIQNILTFGKSCTFFLSKADLRSADETSQVKDELSRELYAIVGDNVSVSAISQNDISLFENFISSLNPEQLFADQFCDRIKDECHDLKASLNTKISALQSDKAKNARAIGELQASIKKIEEKKAKLIASVQNNTFADEADSVASAVGSALSSQVESLTDVAINGGKEALQEEINSIVQNTVASKIQNVTTNITAKFSRELTSDMKGLSDIMNSYNMPDVVAKLQDSAQKMYDVGKANIDSYIADKQEKGKGGGANVAYKTAIGILAATTTIVAPWIEIIIMLLPEIINLLFGNIQKNNQREQVRGQISGQIPAIKREVRGKVSQLLQENSSGMISNISQNFDEQLKQKASEIEEATKQLEQNNNTEEQIGKYKNCVVQTDKLLEKLI